MLLCNNFNIIFEKKTIFYPDLNDWILQHFNTIVLVNGINTIARI